MAANEDPDARPLIIVVDLLDDEAVHPLLCPHCWEFTGAWFFSPSGKATCLVCDGTFSIVDRKA